MSFEPRQKHRPQRTCAGCREVKDQKELVRLVKLPDGTVEIDTGNRKPGRGAYVCPTKQCWESGLKGNRIERSLKTSISRGNREQLYDAGKDLFK